ncbi:DUF3108 domain-containing protein [Alteromonas antoniana]|uniref:DUF3108 domain-containing protein n=1 Tax=Alteromonas antoniana TaxID=2803813 RepID=UPI001C452630|nr:DUF3108 domain-containing protein [Alteromonas antoniana]
MKSFRLAVSKAINSALTGLVLLGTGTLPAIANTTGNSSSVALTPFHAQYTAYKWDDDVGNVEMKLERLSPSQYSLTYSSKVSKFFLSDKRYEHSIFTVEDGKLVPSQYYYSRSGTGPDDKLNVTFGKNGSDSVQVESEDENYSLEWDNEIDNQIYRIDLPRKLASGESTTDYYFINYRGQKRHYGIEVVGKEKLNLPYGQLDTIKVKLVRDSKTRETFAWFAPELDYNLVRLQQFKDGDEQGDIKLRSYVTLAEKR